MDLTKHAWTLTGAVLTLSLSGAIGEMSWLVSLLPLPLLVPACWLALNALAQIIRHATYLRVFHADVFPWEVRLAAFRANKPRGWPNYNENVGRHFTLIGATCLFVSLVQIASSPLDQKTTKVIIWTVFVIAWVGVSFVSLKQWRRHGLGATMEEACLSTWENVAAVPRFQVSRTSDGHFVFLLRASSGEMILTSQPYTTKASAQKGIESVRTNSPQVERYERCTSEAGEPYFVLKAANHEIIGTSEMYSSDSAMEHGIRSLVENGKRASVEGQA